MPDDGHWRGTYSLLAAAAQQDSHTRRRFCSVWAGNIGNTCTLFYIATAPGHPPAALAALAALAASRLCPPGCRGHDDTHAQFWRFRARLPACPPTACLPAPAAAPPLGSLHLSPVTATMEIRTVRSFVHAALQQAGCGPPVQSVPTHSVPSVPSAHFPGCQAITSPGPAGHGDQLGSRRPIQHQQHGGRAARAEVGNRPSASVPLQSPLWPPQPLSPRASTATTRRPASRETAAWHAWHAWWCWRACRPKHWKRGESFPSAVGSRRRTDGPAGRARRALSPLS